MAHFLTTASFFVALLIVLEGKPRQCFIGSIREYKSYRTFSNVDACIIAFDEEWQMAFSSFHMEEDEKKSRTMARRRFAEEHIYNCGHLWATNLTFCACYWDDCNRPTYLKRFLRVGHKIQGLTILDNDVVSYYP